MPEGIEIEYYRRAAEAALDRVIREVHATDLWYLKGGTAPEALSEALIGQRLVAARRIGKLLLVDVSDDGSPASSVGLRFGMTGRLLVDDHAVIERLEYSSDRDDPAWDRFALTFDDGGRLVMRDPRRLGGVVLDPDLSGLGVDLYAVTGADLTRILSGSTRPLKARLLDQQHIAGLGNLLTDEILWRASLDPRQASDSLTAADRRRLLRHLRRTVDELTERGGSHTGDLQAHRHVGASCPRDGAPLERHAVGGRTTYSCTEHQAREQ